MHNRHPDNPIPNRPRAPQRALRVGGGDAANRCIGAVPGIEGKRLLVFGKGSLNGPERDPRFEVNREFRRIVSSARRRPNTGF